MRSACIKGFGGSGSLTATPITYAAAVAVVGVLPQVWNAAAESGDISGLAQIATLTYSLPWGVGLAVVGWMRGRSAVAAGVTVVVSVLLCTMFVVATHMLHLYSTYPIGD